jgi:hypothetical protein
VRFFLGKRGKNIPLFGCQSISHDILLL